MDTRYETGVYIKQNPFLRIDFHRASICKAFVYTEQVACLWKSSKSERDRDDNKTKGPAA